MEENLETDFIDSLLESNLADLKKKVMEISYDPKKSLAKDDRDKMIAILLMHRIGYNIRNLDEEYLRKNPPKTIKGRVRFSEAQPESFFNMMPKVIFEYKILPLLDYNAKVNLGSTCRNFYEFLRRALRNKFNNHLVSISNGYDFQLRIKAGNLKAKDSVHIDDCLALTENMNADGTVNSRSLVKLHNYISNRGGVYNNNLCVAANKDLRKYFGKVLNRRFLELLNSLKQTHYRLYVDDLEITNSDQFEFIVDVNNGHKSVKFYKNDVIIKMINVTAAQFGKGKLFGNHPYLSQKGFLGQVLLENKPEINLFEGVCLRKIKSLEPPDLPDPLQVYELPEPPIKRLKF